jgi:hypothetical protein
MIALVTWWQTPVSWPADCPDKTPGYGCGPGEIDDSVRLLYHFDEGSGATPDWTADCSGSTYAPHDFETWSYSLGNLRGSAQIHEDSAFFGQSGLSVDGVDSFMFIASDLEFQPQTGDYTLDVYTKIDSTSPDYPVMFGSIVASPDLWFGLEAGFISTYNIVHGFTTSVITNVRDDNWHHLVWARSGTTVLMFVDGKLERATVGWNDNIDDFLDVMGIAWNLNNHRWKGDIDEFRYTVGVCRWTEEFVPPIYASGSTTTADSDDVLLIHSNHYEGSTTFTDSSDSAHSITANGQVHHELDGRKFLLSGVSFEGTQDNLSIADHADFDFGSGDFTIEWWMSTTNAPAVESGIMGQLLDGSTVNISFYIKVTGDDTVQARFCSGAVQYDCESGVIIDGDYRHFAWVRDGNIAALYVSGTSVDSVDVTGLTINDPNTPLVIGEAGQVPNLEYLGYLDEIKISKGVARYTSDFTPPTEPF